MTSTLYPRFDEAVILITGAASGIGRRAVERFAEAGATVVAGDIAAVPTPRPDSDYVHLDVADEADWQKVMSHTLERFGRLDALINCAGIVLMANVVDTTVPDFRRVMAINVEGTFLGMKHAMRAMLGRGVGSIVNVSSAAGLVGSPGASAYCASKGAVRLMTKAVALEAIAAGTRIRINSLHPGLTETPMVEKIMHQLGGAKELRGQLESMLPAGRLASPDDIVDGMMFLISNQSSFINGAELVVDNGFTAQ